MINSNKPFRVLVDWDNDSWFNVGVPTSTPINVFPSAPYIGQAKVRGLQPTSGADYFEDIPEVTDQGLATRKIKCGWTAGADYAATVRWGFGAYHEFQPQEGDPINLLDNAANFNWTGGYVSGYTRAPGGLTFVEALLNGSERPYGRRVLRLDGTHGATSPGFMIGGAAGGSTSSYEYFASGYHDGSNQYSAGVDATHALTYKGWAVSASTQYTLVYWVKAAAGSTPTLKARIYTNGGSSSTPNFTRQYVTGEDYVTTNSWVKRSFTFTTPAGGTQLVLDFQPSNTNPIYIGGFMLMAGSQTVTRFWDNTVVFSDDQFDYTLAANKAYVLSFWVKSPDGITSVTGQTREARLGTNTIDAINNSYSFSVTSSWTRINISMPSRAYDRAFFVNLTPKKSGVDVGLNVVGELQFSGLMLTEGTSTSVPYHAGSVVGYDDITDYVLSFRTSSGKRQFENFVTDEGEAELPVNNDTRIFSPSNTASPIYGYLKDNRRVVIQVWRTDTNVFETIWTGWTHSFDINPGTTSDRQASIQAVQGIFRLSDGQLPAVVSENLSLDEVIRLVISNSGWISSSQHAEETEGGKTLTDISAYTVDEDNQYSEFQETFNTYEVVGHDWSKDKEPRAALEEALQAESAMMWLDRKGRIKVVNREHWIKKEGITDINLDEYVTVGEYQYGKDIINQVEVKFDAKSANSDDDFVWSMKRPLAMKGAAGISQKQGFRRDIKTVDINPEFEEKRPKTVLSISDTDIIKTVWTKPPNKFFEGGELASAAYADATGIRLEQDNAGRYRLRIINNNTGNVWVKIELKGKWIETGDRSNVIVEDLETMDNVDAIYRRNIQNALIEDDIQAESAGQFSLLRQSEAVGEFKSIKINVNDDSHLIDALALEIGDFVSLSEYQTAENDIVHAIIGEHWEYNGGEFSVDYDLAYVEKTSYALADEASTVPETLNYIEDMGNIYATGYATIGYEERKAEGLEELQWIQQRSPYEVLFLSPHSRQIMTIDNSGFKFWPDFSSTGADARNNRGGILRKKAWGFSYPVVTSTETNSYYTLPDEIYLGDYAGSSDASGFYGTGAVGGTLLWRLYSGFRPLNTQYAGAASDNDGQMTIPVLKDKKYRKYMITGNNAGSAGIPRVVAIDRVNGIREVSRWASSTAADFSDRVDNVLPGLGVVSTHDLRMRTASTSIPLSWVTLLTETSSANLLTRIFKGSLVLMEGIGSVYLDSTKSHKYAAFLRMAPESSATSYTLTVYDKDGAVINTASGTISKTAVTKLEVSIPTGNTWVYATLHKTTEDYQRDRFYVYGYGISEASPTSYLDYYTASDDVAYTYI